MSFVAKIFSPVLKMFGLVSDPPPPPAYTPPPGPTEAETQAKIEKSRLDQGVRAGRKSTIIGGTINDPLATPEDNTKKTVLGG